MKTIRKNVFETNSSTTHCISFSKEYKNITEIPMRDKSEFPALNADGDLEIELDTFWDSDVRENDWDFSSVEVFIKYLCAQAVFSYQESIYGCRKNTEYVDNFEKNHVAFLKDLKEAYIAVGLTPPNDFKPYFIDVNDNKVYVNKDNNDKWFNTFENSWYSDKREYNRYINNTKKKHPDAVNWPYTKYRIGVCGNDLSHYSYESATKYYESNVSFYDSTDEDSEMEFNTVDVLTRKVTLGFYHT